MADSLADLKTGWWSFSLPGYRDHPTPATYSLFSYKKLPTIQAPADPDWHWLESQPQQAKWSLSANSYPDGSRPDLSHLRPLLEQLAFEMPAEFVAFFEMPSLHRRIRSCTGCMLELSDFPVSTRAPPNGAIIQFLVDQQSVLRWYLFADSASTQAVLVSGEVYGMDYSPTAGRRESIDLFRDDFWLCAHSFYEFIFRFWLENEVCFALTERRQPTPEQLDYLSYYQPGIDPR
jgi:hypothetical protein